MKRLRYCMLGAIVLCVLSLYSDDDQSGKRQGEVWTNPVRVEKVRVSPPSVKGGLILWPDGQTIQSPTSSAKETGHQLNAEKILGFFLCCIP